MEISSTSQLFNVVSQLFHHQIIRASTSTNHARRVSTTLVVESENKSWDLLTNTDDISCCSILPGLQLLTIFGWFPWFLRFLHLFAGIKTCLCYKSSQGSFVLKIPSMIIGFPLYTCCYLCSVNQRWTLSIAHYLYLIIDILLDHLILLHSFYRTNWILLCSVFTEYYRSNIRTLHVVLWRLFDPHNFIMQIRTRFLENNNSITTTVKPWFNSSYNIDFW